tara:strand:+ start:270 stop:617 length:348 start_codon:yes stop_codon:yes gene_type:complete
MTTLADINLAIIQAMNSPPPPQTKREKDGECVVCGLPNYKVYKKEKGKRKWTFYYNTNEKDERPKLSILKNYNRGGFSVVNTGAESHTCVIRKPTHWTAELFVKEIMKKLEEVKA